MLLNTSDNRLLVSTLRFQQRFALPRNATFGCSGRGDTETRGHHGAAAGAASLQIPGVGGRGLGVPWLRSPLPSLPSAPPALDGPDGRTQAAGRTASAPRQADSRQRRRRRRRRRHPGLGRPGQAPSGPADGPSSPPVGAPRPPEPRAPSGRVPTDRPTDGRTRPLLGGGGGVSPGWSPPSKPRCRRLPQVPPSGLGGDGAGRCLRRSPP